MTGTPISRGLEDLQGLAAFLRLNPWSDKQWWGTALQRPTEAGDPVAFSRLLRVLRPALGGIMWRSAKRDVANELQLPLQSCSVTHLALSAVERHWYTRQHQVGSNDRGGRQVARRCFECCPFQSPLGDSGRGSVQKGQCLIFVQFQLSWVRLASWSNDWTPGL